MDGNITIEFEIITDFCRVRMSYKHSKNCKKNRMSCLLARRVIHSCANTIAAHTIGWIRVCVTRSLVHFFFCSFIEFKYKETFSTNFAAMYNATNSYLDDIFLLSLSIALFQQVSRFSSTNPFIYIWVGFCLLRVFLFLLLFTCRIAGSCFFVRFPKWKSIDLKLGECNSPYVYLFLCRLSIFT